MIDPVRQEIGSYIVKVCSWENFSFTDSSKNDYYVYITLLILL